LKRGQTLHGGERANAEQRKKPWRPHANRGNDQRDGANADWAGIGSRIEMRASPCATEKITRIAPIIAALAQVCCDTNPLGLRAAKASILK
jgi:hypothetical protein